MAANLRKRVAIDFRVFFPPVMKGDTPVAYIYRDGDEIIDRLRQDFDLILWSAEKPDIVEEFLDVERQQFAEVHFWHDNAFHWKDVREINADFLIDDDPHHLEIAMTVGIWERYILVEPLGSPKDIEDPFLWAKTIENALYAK